MAGREQNKMSKLEAKEFSREYEAPYPQYEVVPKTGSRSSERESKNKQKPCVCLTSANCKPKRRPPTKQNWNRFRQPLHFHCCCIGLDCCICRDCMQHSSSIAATNHHTCTSEASAESKKIRCCRTNLTSLRAQWHSPLFSRTGQTFTTAPPSSPRKTSIEER